VRISDSCVHAVCVRRTCEMSCESWTAESQTMKKKPDLFKVGLAYILGCQKSSPRAEVVSTLVVTSAGLLLLTATVSTLWPECPASPSESVHVYVSVPQAMHLQEAPAYRLDQSMVLQSDHTASVYESCRP
jgi:hypothetical protein